jgi:hypothetical protein
MPMAKRNKSSLSEAAKIRQATSKELNKIYREEAAKLKAKGVLSARVNARKNISRHTRTKINKYRDVLEGRAIPVRVSKPIRQRYAEKGMLGDPDFLTERGPFIMVPSPYKNMKAQLEKGDQIRVTRHLKNGQEEYVIFPYTPSDLPGIAERLMSDPTLDGMKYEDELFSFRLNGHNARESFITAEEMGEYLLKYLQSNVLTLTFQRFKMAKGASDVRTNHPGTEPKIYTKGFEPGSNRSRYDRSGRNSGWYNERKAQTAAARKKRQRERETPEETAARRAKDKAYQKQKRRYGRKRDQ